MTVLGIVGSPRKGSNTDILVETVLEGGQINGHEVSKVYLYDQDVGGCIDCRGCKKEPFSCIVDDGMRHLYSQLDTADVIVFGTPVYWYGPSGPMKVLIDRLRPYYSSGKLAGKRAVLASPAADGPGDAELLVKFFNRVCAALKIERAGVVLGTAYDRKEILADDAALETAREIGAGL